MGFEAKVGLTPSTAPDVATRKVHFIYFGATAPIVTVVSVGPSVSEATHVFPDHVTQAEVKVKDVDGAGNQSVFSDTLALDMADAELPGDTTPPPKPDAPSLISLKKV